MAIVNAVTPEEAQRLLESDGYTYVDVRSELEFEQGHPAGALNVPLSQSGPTGMVPNAEFLEVMVALFDKSAKLVIGCQSGGRSRRAAAQLIEAGFGGLVEMSAGFGGGRDAFGRPLPGWRSLGLPTGSGTPDDRSYADIRRRLGR